MFYEKVKALCKERGTTPSKMLLELGMSKSNVTKWKEGKFPKVEMLMKIATFLGVEAARLLPEENPGD